LNSIPVPGSFGLAVISGKTGYWVRKGQNIVEGRKTHYTHAFLVLDNNEVIEAEPGGAILTPLSKYMDGGDVLFCDKPVKNAVGNQLYPYDGGEKEIRERVIDFGRSLKGIPYNYMDYLAIGLEHFNIDLRVVRNRVRRPDRLICSQLVDFVYQMAGIHLFDDGRVSQDVTPADLEWYANAA
jgi:hypothetical protein